MRFTWNEAKRKINVNKHRLDFADVSLVFAGDTITILDDRRDYGEDRFVTLGLLHDQVVVIVHTESDDVIRIISMRKALRHEAENYFTQIGD